MSAGPRIASLHYYPVKSARGIELDRALLSASGFAEDRQWMVVSNTGRFLTQRELPRLALLRPWLSHAELVLKAPAMPEICVPLARTLERRCVTVWNDSCPAFDEGDTVAAWLQSLLNRECRLVRFDNTHRRLSSRTWTGATEAENRFSDGFPILVLSSASLADLNSRLDEPLPMNRFRPNIVLDGLQPYDEDRIDEFTAGEVTLRLVKACTRCAITATNQDNGQLEGDQPLRALRGYRYDAALRGVAFGQNAIIISGFGSTLARGQSIALRWKEHAAS